MLMTIVKIFFLNNIFLVLADPPMGSLFNPMARIWLRPTLDNKR